MTAPLPAGAVPSQAAPAAGPATRAEFERLLDELADAPEREADLCAQIDATFGAECAVVVFDMSGFSRTTRALGIVPFLGMIRMVQRLAQPAIEAAGGRVLKIDADNLWCVLPDVPEAVAAARAVRDRLDAANVALPAERELHLSAGIGYGRILVIDDSASGDAHGGDMYGDEVNLAGKLGEDLAGRDEVLLSPRAASRSREAGLAERQLSISGLSLTCYALPHPAVAS